MKTIAQPMCGVIPPHILRHVAEHGDDEARETIASTVQHSALIAEHRQPAAVEYAEGKAAGRKQRKVYDAEHGRALPGQLLMTERKTSSTDREASEAFNGSGVTYDFFRTVFNRDSIDGRGLPLISTVHYGTRFDNALWDGNQMIYGDGDGKLFRRFTAAVDIAGHELTHGVTQHTAVLEYNGQSGALNEHFSDAFGIMVKQYALGQTASQSSWIIGEGLFTKRVNGAGVRSMKAPGTAYDDPILGRDPQPAHMRQYLLTDDDNGGVHINSGIPNHAFYLAASAIGGHTWKVLGRIWYQVLTERLKPRAQFADVVRETISAAGALFGAGGQVQNIVAEAWEAVGLPLRVCTAGRRSAALPKWRRQPAAAITNNRTANERKN
jgi:Zn-dependent metalloprotease